MAKTNLTPERLRELLHYDPETGIFTRRDSGVVAGGIEVSGRITVGIDGKRFYAYRLAWLYMCGYWPTEDIDHIDGNKRNDRIGNLREATKSQNAQNLSKRKKNKHGLVGVCWDRSRQKWKASIIVNGKTINAGRFPTPELAHAAYCAAKAKYHTFNPVLRD